MKRFLVIAGLLLLAGCGDQKAWMQKLVPPDDDAFARRFVELVKKKQYDQARPMLDPGIRNENDPNWDKLNALIDQGEPQSFETVICAVNYLAVSGSANTKQVELGYQLHFAKSWLLVDVVTRTSDSARFIAGVHFIPIADSLEVLNRFDFNHKRLIHQLFFVACVLVPLFVIVTALICFGLRVRRRWLWIIFILLGCFVQFQINWTTGGWNVRPLAFVFLGAGFQRVGLYGPWILQFAIPVGAMVFLLCLPWLRRKDEPPPLPAEIPSPN